MGGGVWGGMWGAGGSVGQRGDPGHNFTGRAEQSPQALGLMESRSQGSQGSLGRCL